MDAEHDEPVQTGGPESTGPGYVRKRAGRNAIRDLAIPVLAIAAVVTGIVVVQLIRERNASTNAPSTSGEYYSLNLGSTGEGAPKVGEPAPGFQLLDLEGETIRLEDFRGRPVLINFWATWCVPCRKETPDLVALQAEWGDTAQILGVNYSEPADVAQEFATDFSVNYPTPLDTYGEVTGSYKLRGLPETFFLDEQGVIRDHRIGQLDPDVARCIVAGIQAGGHEPEDCR
ncbi:MAG: TlpA family protein disulfide reductase [Dehalococcoidia bacterium]